MSEQIKAPGSQSVPPESETALSDSLSQGNQLEHLRDSTIARLYKDAASQSHKVLQHKKTRLFATHIRKNQLAVYSHVLAKLIPLMISEGWLLSDICDLPGMPSTQDIAHWKEDHEQFRKDMDLAYKTRAEVMADKALKVADASKFATAKSDQIKVETLKWASEKGDPDRYGSKKQDTTNNFAFFFQSSFNPENKEPRKVIIETRDPSLVFQEEVQSEQEKVSGSDNGNQREEILPEGGKD